MVSILSNGVDFLSIARGSFQNNGIGLSARARQFNQDFLDQGKVLFNTLYLQTEDAELNLAKQILGIRARLGVDRDDIVLRSQSLGREVDEEA